MVWPAVIAAGGAIASSVASGMFSKSSQKDAIDAQVAWNREQAQNRHQWEVEDLRKAGLNPILSANSGASASGISVPSAQLPTVDFSPAVQAYSAKQQRELVKQQTAQSAEITKKLSQEVEQMRLSNEKLQLELDNIKRNPHLITTGGTATNMPTMLHHGLNSVYKWFTDNVADAKSVDEFLSNPDKGAYVLKKSLQHIKKTTKRRLLNSAKKLSGTYRGLND